MGLEQSLEVRFKGQFSFEMQWEIIRDYKSYMFVKDHSGCYVKNSWKGARMSSGFIRDAK